jgi:hypothetical protein
MRISTGYNSTKAVNSVVKMTLIMHMKGVTPAIIGATGMVEFNADQVFPLLQNPVRYKIALSTGYGSYRMGVYSLVHANGVVQERGRKLLR